MNTKSPIVPHPRPATAADDPHRFEPANLWVEEQGREYVAIDGLQDLEPFFLNIVGAGNQWLFCSSHGALTAGRESPESALFPYYTVDKIIDNWNTTGPWTGLVLGERLWTPFRPSIARLTPIRRRLMKGLLGDEVVFEEFHEEFGLRFSYRWRFAPSHGFVRSARLVNEGSKPRTMRLVDGLDNFLPPGIGSRMQLQYSCLADAYKVTEILAGGRLAVHRLAAGITDEPIPLESLLATTVWSVGLGGGDSYADRRHAEDFLRGSRPPSDQQVRAKRGALFLARELTLAPGESREWMMVAEIDQSQARVGALLGRLAEPEALRAEVEADIEDGRARLHALVAAADGFQQTADRDAALYHYHNTLSNILRGGVPAQGYQFTRSQFARHLRLHHRPLAASLGDWLEALPDPLDRGELLARTAETGDPDLHRIAEEYLPLVLSRRHGDPTRPWNRFFIRTENDSGEAVHHFEGNWRDIFQNWEALAWSYPDDLDGIISKFLNASTIDGFNPYRITSEGVDWEVPDPGDPWASIGYWGDHQIVYLLKLLELESRLRPERLSARLDSERHVYVDVPYRLASWERTLEDPRDTVEFDRQRHELLMARKAEIGADGLLLRHPDGRPVRATLAEKLLLPAAVKLANLVPDGGIWMNTQRPEWNDANNALAGCGLSVVTGAYLYRYLGRIESLLAGDSGPGLRLSPALHGLLETLSDLFADPRWHAASKLGDADRFELVEMAGRALERHRRQVYDGGPGEAVPVERAALLTFLGRARDALERTLRQARRPDGLWHAYQVLHIGHGSLGIEQLPLMLEGQVAILSSGILSPEEAAGLLRALPESELWSARHRSYLLYPDRPARPFLGFNRVAADALSAIGTLAAMADAGDHRLLVPDPDGGYRFDAALTSGYALRDRLDQLAGDPALAAGLATDRPRIEALYEATFNHRAFTGRSGTMFGYEGLGCIYWHMVSKLMLAAQEVTLDAIRSAADPATVDSLVASYFGIQRGLGFRKPAEEYGAFPAEPYSHSPAHAGAQQPGLTGQVKEGILCRLGELGVDFRDGRLEFRPRLLRRAEFGGLPARPEHPALAEGTLAFTVAETPVRYRVRENLTAPRARVRRVDGSELEFPEARLDPATTRDIAGRTGRVAAVEVEIPSHWLVS